MNMSLLGRLPMPVKLGVPVAAGLLAAACGTAAGSTTGSTAAGAPDFILRDSILHASEP